MNEVELETKTVKKNVFFWAMYDLANTIYSMVIVSLIIFRYIMVIAQVEDGITYGQASFIFGLVQGLMQAGLAIAVPIVGAFGDQSGKRKPYVITLGGLCCLFASLLGFWHSLWVVLFFFILANVSYQLSLIFYDAMIPFIASKEDIGKVSGFGIAWGYFGTIISLIVLLPLMFMWGDVVSDPTQGDLSYGYTGYWITFVLPMVLFFILMIPFFFVREKQKGKMAPVRQVIGDSLRQLKATLKDIKQHKPMVIYIFAYFLIGNVAQTLIVLMMPLVTDGLIIGTGGQASDIIGVLFILIGTVSAVIFTTAVGKFGQKHGPKKCFYLVCFFWAISLIIGIYLIFTLPYIDIGLNYPFILALMMVIIVGPALGGTWAANRIMVTRLSPKEKFGEYFGFTSISGKASASLGPIIFGTILLTADVIGKYAWGLGLCALGVIMILGLILLKFVKVSEKM
ncbi:MAG: MFS transporter [Promethearchaeota archaeon]|nr:MAG: MFS transporter [Candidatus Lokiarchaeota archaeon]